MSAALGIKLALITGSASGLGEALCDGLLGDGWQVTGVDLNTPDDAANGMNSIRCDLSDRAAVDALLAGDELGGPYDLVVLNAAVSATGKFQDIPFEVHQKLLRLNAETPMLMAASLAGSGRISQGGKLVFVSSLSHFVGYPGAASYAASKDAVAVYAKSIRKPFARRGIKVSCVFPGPMKTDQAERHSPQGAQADKRMPPEIAARHILSGVARGARMIIPGGGPKAFSWFGRLAPWASDRSMRKIIFEKLDRDVY